MPETEPTAELDQRFSSPGATATPWSAVRDVLNTSEMFWLSTVRRDGRPHSTPLPAIWHEGCLHICTGDQEQKAVNLMAEPRCTLGTGSNLMSSGLDVVVEGTAARVTDEAVLHRLAELWKWKLNWDFTVHDGGFGDAEGRTGLVFAVTPAKVIAFSKGEPYGQTRYRFRTA